MRDLLGAARRVGVIGDVPGAVRRVLGDVVELDAAYAKWRLVKSPEELAHLRYAGWLTDRSAAALVEAAVPGASELDLIEAVESSYAGTGATNHIHYVAATSMAAPDRCVPGQWPTDRVLAGGSAVMFELSTTWGQDTPGQLLRTVTIEAEPTPLYAELHGLATEVHDAMVAQLRPGALPAELLAAADPVLAKGFVTVDDLVHGFGGGYLAPVLSHRGATGRRARRAAGRGDDAGRPAERRHCSTSPPACRPASCTRSPRTAPGRCTRSRPGCSEEVPRCDHRRRHAQAARPDPPALHAARGRPAGRGRRRRHRRRAQRADLRGLPRAGRPRGVRASRRRTSSAATRSPRS